MSTNAASPRQLNLTQLLHDIETERSRYNDGKLIRKPPKLNVGRWLNGDEVSMTRTYIRRAICVFLKTVYSEIGPEVFLLLLSIRHGTWFENTGQQVDALLDRLQHWWCSADKPQILVDEAGRKGPDLYEKTVRAIGALDKRLAALKAERNVAYQRKRRAATLDAQASREPPADENALARESRQAYDSEHMQQEMHELAPPVAPGQIGTVQLPTGVMNSHVLGVNPMGVSLVNFHFGDADVLPMQGYAYDVGRHAAAMVLQGNRFQRVQVFLPFEKGNSIMVIEMLPEDAFPVMLNS